MEVHVACCYSTIENASQQYFALVKDKLAEIIDSSTAMLEEDFPIPGGRAELRKALLTEGVSQLGAKFECD